MRTSILAPLFCLAASSLAQGPPEGVAPDAAAPEGCKTTVEGAFRIGTLENPTLRRRETAQEASDGDLLCTLEDGILHDQYGRTGSIVANQQFQFDGPPQAGAIYTGGFAVCGNDSLAIGGSTRWWRCMSGAFGNLYDTWIGDQCHEIRIQAVFQSTSSSESSSEMTSSTTSAALSGSTSLISASETSGLTSESRSMSHSVTSGASSGAFSTATPYSNSATDSTATSGASQASETSAAAAPPADGAASSLSMAPFALFSASMVFLGAAIML